jgi:hypothetical protein
MRFLVALLFVLSAVRLSAQLNLELLAHVPNDSGVTLSGCWHYVDSTGGEYALVGTRMGLDIWNLDNPTQPERLFQVPGIVNNWREVKTWGGYAYVGSEAVGSGITIVDLRHLPDSIRWKVWTGNDSLTNQINQSHTVAATDGYLYVFGSKVPNMGAIICSLEDPWNPDFVGQYQLNYLHDGHIRGDTLWGSEIYQGQFSVIDISDPTQPVLLATQPTPGTFNHNTELSKSGQFLFTTDERVGAPLGSFDVQALDNITLLDRYFPSQKPTLMVHNVRVLGSDPSNLIETAWTVVGNSLVWDADPYLPSGIVFATAKAEGFFVFQPTYQRAARLRGLVTNAATGAPLIDAKVFILNTPNADTTGISGQYATGAAGSGTYTVRVERAGFFSKEIPNVVLTSGQTDTLDVALEVDLSSTDEPRSAAAPRVWPTVVTDDFWVEWPTAASTSGWRARLYDASGRTVLNEPLKGSRSRLSAPAGCAAGAYFLVLENGVQQSATVKLQLR